MTLEHVGIINPGREQWVGKTGEVVKRDTREGRPYLGVQFEGVGHIVWFYESEVEYFGA